MMKKLISLLLALLVVMSLAIPAFAAERATLTVTGKNKFEYDVQSLYTDTDLFNGFKNVMTGDTLTQEIRIENKCKSYDYIKVYLKAVPHGSTNLPVYDKAQAAKDGKTAGTIAEMEEFLSQMIMRVYNKNGKLIYEGDPVKGPEKTSLGTLRKNKHMDLTVELDVPISMNNTFANRLGEVDWEFTVEYRDDPSYSPKTGDYVIIGAVALLALSGAALVILLVLKKKRKK